MHREHICLVRVVGTFVCELMTRRRDAASHATATFGAAVLRALLKEPIALHL